MKKLFSKVLWIILTCVFCIVFIALMIGSDIAFKNQNAINMTLGARTKELENASDDVRYATDYSAEEQSGEARYQEDAAMIERAEAEGAVLLWNKADALPLAGNEKISLFGHASVSLVEAGSGSGWSRTYDVFMGGDRTVTMKDALTSRGFYVNETLWNVYANGAAKDYKMTHPTWQCVPWQQWMVHEAPWEIIEDAAGSTFASYGDVAIITLSRLGGEYSDLHYNYKNKEDFVGDNDKGLMENTSADGGYLGLSDEEDELLSQVTALRQNNKTEVLQPQKSETVTVRVDEDSFKSYDADNKKTYVIEEGKYYLTAGANAHAALNNILAAQGETGMTQEVMGGDCCATAETVGNAVTAIDVNTFIELSKSPYTGAEVTNQLESGDINKYENRGSNSVVYLTRSDWETYPTEPVKLTLNEAMAADLRRDTVPDSDGVSMPVYQDIEGTRVSQGVRVADVSKGDSVAFEFIDAPLDERDADWSEEWEAKWNDLLDQMAQSEQIAMVSSSFHKIHGAVSIALPESYQENGPVGITKREDTKYIFAVPNQDVIDKNNFVFVAYPCAGILAASFDVEIAEDVGEHKSEDMLYLGYNGVYGPGVNMHRSPFGGRAFEYPSEDPLLAGLCEAYETMGIESKGCMAYAKHFALNDMETNRINCGVWSDEQASREIYLRAFEIVFTRGGASATMNAYTRVGTKWAGASRNLLTNILRDEWGFDGIVISDWVTKDSGMSLLDGVMAGTDAFDANNEFSAELEKYTDNAAVMQAVRTATKHIIYNVVRTNAMNNFDINTVVLSITPAWGKWLIAIDVIVGVLAAASMGMLAASIVLGRRRKRAEVQKSAEK